MMALGGGFYSKTNKVVPGAYVNYRARLKAKGYDIASGVVAVALNLKWGDELIKVEADSFVKQSYKLFGLAFDDVLLSPIRELIKGGAKTVYVYNLGLTEHFAQKSHESLTVKAKKAGELSNNIKVVVRQNIDVSDKFDIDVFFGKVLVFSQVMVGDVSEISENDFVTFSGTLSASAGLTLEGGKSKDVVENSDYVKFIEYIESVDFNILVCNADSLEVVKVFHQFTKRMRDEEGKKFQFVYFSSSYKANDYAAVRLVDGKGLYWVAGMPSVPLNVDLTNALYTGSESVSVVLNSKKAEEMIEGGYFAFYKANNEVRVLADINSMVDVLENTNEDFKNNQIIRIIDRRVLEVANIFNYNYLGKIQNNADGRMLLWNDVVNSAKGMEKAGILENYNGEATKISYVDKKSVSVVEEITPISTMTKLYMNIEVI